MTVSANSRRREYQGNGVTRVFNGPMAYVRSHVLAFLVKGQGMIQVPSGSYDVSRLGAENGTTVTMATAPAAGEMLLLLRTMPYTQETDITNQGAFNAEIIEKGFDSLEMQIQQLADFSDRAVHLPDTYPAPLPSLKLPFPEPMKAIGWNYEGTALRNLDLTGPADLSLRSDLSESGGAGLVGFRQSGVGSVARTIQAKNREFLSPEDFGAIGDDAADDYLAIQAMFDAVPSGGLIVFPAGRTYRNANASPTRFWQINKPMTIQGGGSTLTKPAAVSGQNQVPVIKVASSGVTIKDMKIRVQNQKGKYRKFDGTADLLRPDISLSQAIDYGIFAQLADDINLIDVDIEGAAFNIWAKSVRRLRVQGSLSYSAQVVPNITPTDLAFGAGIKLSDVEDFNIDVRGNNNANATVEVESDNYRGIVKQVSKDCVSNGLVILNSYPVVFDSVSVNCGTGTLIANTSVTKTDSMLGVTGRVVSRKCYNYGVSVYQVDGVSRQMAGLSLDVTSVECGNGSGSGTDGSRAGALFRNLSSAYSMTGIDVKYVGLRNATPANGNDLTVTGDVRATFRGSSEGCYNGVLVNGTQSAAAPPIFEMDLRQVATVAFAVSAGSRADFAGTRTPTQYLLTSAQARTLVQRMGTGGSFGAYENLVTQANFTYAIGLPSAASFAGQLYQDPVNSNNVRYRAT